jgi:hypothetical protein
VGENSTLLQFDMSWNSLGTNDDVAMAIATTVEKNESLLHLDLSQNNFSTMQLDVIAEGLKENHTILGLHMEGNSCTVDSRGFVKVLASPEMVSH